MSAQEYRKPRTDVTDLKFAFLRDNGSSNQMAVDGSITTIRFKYQVPTAKKFFVHRQTFMIIDNAVVNAGDFGAIGGGLSTGINLMVKDNVGGNELFDPLDGEAIKRNADFGIIAGVKVQHLPGNRGFGVQWDWIDSLGGRGVLLPEDTVMTVAIRDDLTSLVSFTSTVHGVLVDN